MFKSTKIDKILYLNRIEAFLECQFCLRLKITNNSLKSKIFHNPFFTEKVRSICNLNSIHELIPFLLRNTQPNESLSHCTHTIQKTEMVLHHNRGFYDPKIIQPNSINFHNKQDFYVHLFQTQKFISQYPYIFHLLEDAQVLLIHNFSSAFLFQT